MRYWRKPLASHSVCHDLGIPIREVSPSWSNSELWEEAFVTSSLRLIQHVETVQAPLLWEDIETKTWSDVSWVVKQFQGAGCITTQIQREISERALTEEYDAEDLLYVPLGLPTRATAIQKQTTREPGRSITMYGTRDNPARFQSFAPPAITLPPPLPAHDDPWPPFAPLEPVSPLLEPTGAEAYDQEMDAYYRCTETAAPDYRSVTSVPTKLDETVTSPSFLDVVVNWLVSLAPTCSLEPLLPRYQDK